MNIQPFNLSMVAKAILPLLATSLVVGCNSSSSDSSTPQQPEPSKTARVYYKANSAVAAADASAYDKASLYVWNNDSCNSYAETDPNANDWGTGIAPKG